MSADTIEERLPFKISVCGRGELGQFRDAGVTHLLSIDAPGAPTPAPSWFTGVHRNFSFADVDSRIMARAYGVAAPTRSDVEGILAFGRACLEASHRGAVHLVIHCMAGVSRSPAAAYAIVCMLLGPGSEQQALDYVLQIRPCAYPNRLMVKYADQILKGQ